MRNRQARSATSIGTEENSLRVLRAQTRALIYMRAGQTQSPQPYTSTMGRVIAECYGSTDRSDRNGVL